MEEYGWCGENGGNMDGVRDMDGVGRTEGIWMLCGEWS